MEDLFVKLIVSFLGILVTAFVGLVVWLVKDRGTWSKQFSQDREKQAESTGMLTVAVAGLTERVGHFGEKVDKLDTVLGQMGVAITTFGTETVRLSGRMDTMMERIADRPTRKEVTDEIMATRHILRNEMTEPFVALQLRLEGIEKAKE